MQQAIGILLSRGIKKPLNDIVGKPAAIVHWNPEAGRGARSVHPAISRVHTHEHLSNLAVLWRDVFSLGGAYDQSA